MASEAHLYELDPPTFLHLSGSPHTPASEGLPPGGLKRHQKRAHQDTAGCSVCGGTARHGADAAQPSDPIRNYAVHVRGGGGQTYEPTGSSHGKMAREATKAHQLVVVCGGCMRSKLDGTERLNRMAKSSQEVQGGPKENAVSPPSPAPLPLKAPRIAPDALAGGLGPSPKAGWSLVLGASLDGQKPTRKRKRRRD